MTRTLRRLEVFETTPPDADEASFSAHDVEMMRKTGYEQGYGAGWADAVEQMRDEDALRRAAAMDALQAIDFTYSEACASVEGAFLAMLRNMVELVLPQAMRPALAAILIEEIRAALARQPRATMVIYCAPAARALLEEVVSDFPALSFEVIEEPAFPLERVTLKLGSQSREIDFDHVLGRLRALLDSHAQPLRPSPLKEQMNG